MKYFLENNFVYVEFDLKGCEVVSFYDKNNKQEYIHNADPKFWAGKNPILFPQIGTYKPLIFKNKEYVQKNHGILRGEIFEFVSQTNKCITFKYKSNKESLLLYPYEFEIYVTYTLENTKLNISYQILNLDSDDMPFAFGLHPAFKIDRLENCVIEFEKVENDEYGVIIDKKLVVDSKYFEKYNTLIFENLKSNYVTLFNGTKKLKISTKGFKILAIWSKPNSPFICIEPWLSKANQCVSGEFIKIDDIIILKPNEEFKIDYYWLL